ncbi:MAG: DUF1566 domain-containing protein [Crocinitomicaceae bacterium]|nr:DUF1566 domain-containing protein [Crocinitomicaceae bacterium]
MKRNYTKYLWFGCMIPLLFQCGKNQDTNMTFVTTVEVVNDTTATVDISVSTEDKGNFGSMGLIFGISKNLDLENSYGVLNDNEPHYYDRTYLKGKNEDGNAVSLEITRLNDNTWYYYKPFCVFNGKDLYGDLDSFKTTCPQVITQGPAGGYVVYDNGSGGGIEVAPFDLVGNSEYYYSPPGYEWGCIYSNVPGTQSIIGSGQANTDSILNNCSSLETAAKLCDEFTYGGYSDWYLPSYDELQLLLTTLHANNIGNLSQEWYWSSTQADYARAKALRFASNPGFDFNKDTKNFVRPFRTF